MAPTSSTSETTLSKTTEPPPPVHPFAHIPEAQYIPPSIQNFAAPADKSKEKEKEPTYRMIAPIQDPKVAEEVYERLMKAPFVTLSPAELLSISPEYRQKMHESVTPKRVFPGNEKGETTVATNLNEAIALPFLNAEIDSTTRLPREGAIPPAAAAGNIVVPDLYETYINSLEPGE